MNAGLCETCAFHRIIRSDRGSIFYLCEKSFSDPAFTKYPRLPVLECAGYEGVQKKGTDRSVHGRRGTGDE